MRVEALLKKITVCIILILFFVLMTIFLPGRNNLYVQNVISPDTILLQDNRLFKLNNITTFDNSYSEKNKKLAVKRNISEDEAFILGNLAMAFAENLINNS